MKYAWGVFSRTPFLKDDNIILTSPPIIARSIGINFCQAVSASQF